MKIDFNPFDVAPQSLRTLAHFLNCLAADAEGKPHSSSVQASAEPLHPVLNIDTRPGSSSTEQAPPPPPPLAPNPGNSQDAHGASSHTQNDTADATPVPNTTGSVELDKNGLPWDARIHSSSKNKNQDETWRYTRGGDPAVRAKVEAEWRAKGYGQVAADQTPPPPPPVPAADQTPPPPPPLADQSGDAAPAVTQPLTGEVFKAMNRLTPDLRTEALGVVGLSTPAEFMREVKVRPEIAAPLLEAIMMLLEDE